MARARGCGESERVQSADKCPDVARHDIIEKPRITEQQRLLVAPVLREELARVKERKHNLQEDGRMHLVTALQKKNHQKLLDLFNAKIDALQATLELLIDVSA